MVAKPSDPPVKSGDVESALQVEGVKRRASLDDLGVPRKTSSNTLKDEVKPLTQAKFDPHDITHLVWKHIPRLKFPPAQWLPEYTKDKFACDLNAGVVVMITVIPQGMAYSILAGLPPIYGLYSAIAPLIAYALLGTSREITTGPTAMMSLLTAATIGSGLGIDPEIVSGENSIAVPNPEYIRLAMVIALVCGLIQILLWLLSFDQITNFVSHSVLSGFTSGAGCTIFLSQLKYILGQQPPRYPHAYEYFIYYFENIDDSHYNKAASLGIGLFGVSFLYFFKWFKTKFPANEARRKSAQMRIMYRLADWSTLFMILIAMLISYILIEADVKIKIIGDIPEGMRAPEIPTFTMDDFNKIIVNCVVLAILAYMESFSIGTKFADLAGYRLDNSQEMVAIGVSNVVGSFFGGYLSAGSFSRTAVNAKSGSKSPMSNVITAVLVLCGLYVTKAFYYIPFAALAAIIEVSIVNIIDISAMIHAWKTSKPDFLMMFVSFIITLFLGMEMGIIVGVALSIVLLVYSTSSPHSAVLGKVLIDPLSTSESERNVVTAREAFELMRKDFMQQNELLGVSKEHALNNVKRSVEATTREEIDALPAPLKALHDCRQSLAVAQETFESSQHYEHEESEEVQSLLAHVFRDCERYPHAEIDPQVAVFRFEARIYFANCSFFRTRVVDVMTGMLHGAGDGKGNGPSVVVVDAGPVNSLDLSAVHMLEELHDLFMRRDKTILFCNMKGTVRDFLARAGVTEHFGKDIFFPSIDEAMANALAINRQQVKKTKLARRSSVKKESGDNGS